MIKHIVLWNFVETLSEDEKKEAGLKMKSILEPLKDIIPGVNSLKVVVNELESSNRDIALIGEYESEEALKGYAVHPAHVEAGNYVRSVTCDRACFDYSDEKSALYEKMQNAIQEEYERMNVQMEELKAAGKTKSVTYQTLFGKKMMYKNMLSMYEVYGLR